MNHSESQTALTSVIAVASRTTDSNLHQQTNVCVPRKVVLRHLACYCMQYAAGCEYCYGWDRHAFSVNAYTSREDKLGRSHTDLNGSMHHLQSSLSRPLVLLSPKLVLVHTPAASHNLAWIHKLKIVGDHHAAGRPLLTVTLTGKVCQFTVMMAAVSKDA